MVDEIGRIEKPEAQNFVAKRKVYVVPLIFRGKDAPLEYVAKAGVYWSQVKEHIAKLEDRIGKTQHIYHETISTAGEEGLKILEKLNPDVCEISREKCAAGAVLEAAEDKGLVDECLDWERFILLGFISEAVAEKVSQLYMEAVKKRYDYFLKNIEQTLKPGEAGLVFIQEGNWLQFPRDVEVFSVTPPALDEINRWLRDKSQEKQQNAPQEQ